MSFPLTEMELDPEGERDDNQAYRDRQPNRESSRYYTGRASWCHLFRDPWVGRLPLGTGDQAFPLSNPFIRRALVTARPM